MRPKPRLLEPAPGDDAGIQELADHVNGTIGNILESAAVWYALLYLVQIEGRDDLRFEFDRVTENLSTALVWYVVFTTHKEATNAGQRYFIDGKPLQEVSARQYENHLKREQGVRGLPEVYLTAGGESLVNATILHPSDAYFWLKREGLLDDGPERACQNMRTLFDGMAQEPPGFDDRGLAVAEAFERDGVSGWLSEFNGDAWTAIAEHGANWESPTRVTWVDQSFAVEHNNGNFLDKVKPRGDRRERIGEEVYGTQHLSIYDYQTDFLQTLLDNNHDGNMDYVFGVAAEIDRTFSMGLGLRQAYREAGYPAGQLRSGKNLQPVFADRR